MSATMVGTLHQVRCAEGLERLAAAAASLPAEDAWLLVEDAVAALPGCSGRAQLQRLPGYVLQADLELAGLDLQELGALPEVLDDAQWLSLLSRLRRCISW